MVCRIRRFNQSFNVSFEVIITHWFDQYPLRCSASQQFGPLGFEEKQTNFKYIFLFFSLVHSISFFPLLYKKTFLRLSIDPFVLLSNVCLFIFSISTKVPTPLLYLPIRFVQQTNCVTFQRFTLLLPSLLSHWLVGSSQWGVGHTHGPAGRLAQTEHKHKQRPKHSYLATRID